MAHLEVEVAIIGTGSAGMSAYKAARHYTESVVAIEQEPYGTTCARVGCMPSKLLIAAAEAAHHVHAAERFGIRATASIDGRAVMARLRSERDRFVGFVHADIESWPPADRLIGRARFTGPHILDVGGHTTVTAARIIIATGSRPTWPAAWNQLGDRVIVNDDVFDWEDLPASVAVFGNGVIGLELAQPLHRLGIRTRLFGLGGAIGPLTDPALIAEARTLFQREYRLDPESEVTSVTREGDEVVIAYQGRPELGEPPGVQTERFDYLLAATGRRPNTDGLGLEHSGLALDSRGMPIGFDRLTGRIADSHIFIGGDAAPDVPLLHEAADIGRISGDNAGRGGHLHTRPRRVPLAISFTDPQIAMTGETHRQLTARKASFVTGAADYAAQGRARVMGRNAGLLHVYVEPGSGRFLGAEMIGPDAEHLMHLLAWALQAERTVQQMLDSPFYHPVTEEGIRTALRMARDLAGVPAVDCLDCQPKPAPAASGRVWP